MFPRRRRWLIVLLAVGLLLGLGAMVVTRTPAGRAFFNVAAYRVRLVWYGVVGRPTFDPSRTGSLTGSILTESGAPLPEAVALVSSLRGEVYQARSDAQGRYRIDGIPAGTYVPLAGAWGYAETTVAAVQIRAGHELDGIDFRLPVYRPPELAPSALQLGPAQPATTTFPTALSATRIAFTFALDGYTIDGGQIYVPSQGDGPRPTLLIVYPSAPLNWDAASVALTRDGFVVIASGPDADRGLDIEGHVRDFRAVFQFWQDGRFDVPPLQSDHQRWVLMSGSFGSLIVFRSLRDLPAVPAIVDVGGVSDAFLGVQSLYSENLKIPPPYDNAVAAMGRPDRDPAFFFAYSPIFFAGHLPPIFIVHSYGDEVIPYNQSTALDAALTRLGKPHELLLYEDTTHYLDAYHPTRATYEVFERVMAFAGAHTMRK